jgi:hypothetical protein
MMVTPLLSSGAIPVFVLTAPVFSGRQLLWSGLKSSGSATLPDTVFRPARGYLAFSEAVNAFPPLIRVFPRQFPRN